MFDYLSLQSLYPSIELFQMGSPFLLPEALFYPMGINAVCPHQFLFFTESADIHRQSTEGFILSHVIIEVLKAEEAFQLGHRS